MAKRLHKIHGKMLKLWKADVLEDTAHKQTGEIVKIEKDGICVQTGEGLLKIRELQLEGKKRMDAASFLRGYSVQKGNPWVKELEDWIEYDK